MPRVQGHEFKRLPKQFQKLLKGVDEAMGLFNLHMRHLIYDSKHETKVAIAWSRCASTVFFVQQRAHRKLLGAT
jgi:hypothetical protein